MLTDRATKVQIRNWHQAPAYKSNSSRFHVIEDVKHWSKFKQDWLSDRSIYPLIIIVGTAMSFGIGVGVRCLTTNPDVQLSSSKRLSILRTWGDENEH